MASHPSMHIARLRCILLGFALLAAASTLHAQLPSDNDVWKARCILLTAQASAIQNGSAPASLVAATRGLPAQKFFILAINRAQAGEHYVACTLYSLAALSERAGGSTKVSLKATRNDTILAGAEFKLARRQKLTLAEHLKRGEMKVEVIGKPLSLSSSEAEQVLNAAGTTPITLTPPSAPPAPTPAHKPR